MQKSWREFLTKKYGSDDALRKAWGDNTATLQTTALPLDSTLREKVDRLPQWPNASDMRVERDYALLQKELHARWFRTLVSSVKAAVPERSVLIGIDALKQPMLGWQIQEAFAGRSLGTRSFSMHAASGSIGIGPLMDMPELNILSTPSDYTSRHMGSSHEVEGLGDSMVLRGKTLLNENDTRTFLSKEVGGNRHPTGVFRNLTEVNAGFLRNTSLALSRGFLPFWTDIATAGSYYSSEEVQREVHNDKILFERGSAWPHRETSHAIAVIIDDESPLYENFTGGFQQLAVIRQRIEGLAISGIPYRIHLLSDLKNPNFPNFHCYYFPNLFKVDSEVLSLLRQKIFKDGNVAIFGPGTGITDGEKVSATGAEALLGIPMHLTELSGSRRVALNGTNLDMLKSKHLPAFYGDSLVYGPILFPDPHRLTSANV